jgi:hypothetical protein
MCWLAVAQWRPDVTLYLDKVSSSMWCRSGLSIDCCVLVVGCVLRRNTQGNVQFNQQYSSDEVTMSILVGIRAIGAAASMPNWLLCCVVRATTSWGNDAWWRWRQNRRNKTRKQVFLHDGTLRIDQSWRSPLSYGHHGASLPAFKHTSISQHTMEQVYVVKTRKSYH